MKKLFYFSLILMLISCKDNTKKTTSFEQISIVGKNLIESNESRKDTFNDNSISIRDYDTIKLTNHTLFFEPYNLDTLFEHYYSDWKQRNELTKNLGNSHEKAITIEKYLLKTYNKIFSLNDSILTVKLLNGDSIRLKIWDETSGDGLSHNFDNYFQDQSYVLIYNQYIEGNGYQLVNLKNGKSMYISGLPYFSPENNYVLTTSLDLEAGYNFNGIELYEIDSDTLKELASIELNGWGAERLKWLNNSEAVFEKLIWTVEYNEVVYRKKYSKLTIKKNSQ